MAVVWTDAMKIKLAQLVEQRPHLFDMNLKSYKDLGYKENSWSNIGKHFNCSGSDCSIQWRRIREKYVKVRNKIKFGRIDKKIVVVKWPMYNMLYFLNPFILPRKRFQRKMALDESPIDNKPSISNITGNIQNEDEDTDTELEPLVGVEEDNTSSNCNLPQQTANGDAVSVPTSPILSLNTISTPSPRDTPSPVARYSLCHCQRNISRSGDHTCISLKRSAHARDSDDDCAAIGKAVAASLRNMDQKKRALANKQIFDILFKVAFETD